MHAASSKTGATRMVIRGHFRFQSLTSFIYAAQAFQLRAELTTSRVATLHGQVLLRTVLKRQWHSK